MKYFTKCTTLEELKAEYRRLAMLHHPDRGGDTEIMKEINREHDEIFEILKARQNANAEKNRQTTETAEEFRGIVDKLIKIPGLIIELCGSWLWISGNTREHKEELKKAGCCWSNSKKMWYWRHAEDGCRWSRGKKSIDDIRKKYGSQIFDGMREDHDSMCVARA